MRPLSFLACVAFAVAAILYLLRHDPTRSHAAAGNVVVSVGPHGARITDTRTEPGAGGCCRG